MWLIFDITHEAIYRLKEKDGNSTARSTEKLERLLLLLDPDQALPGGNGFCSSFDEKDEMIDMDFDEITTSTFLDNSPPTAHRPSVMDGDQRPRYTHRPPPPPAPSPTLTHQHQ
jgi:hypothetical protein